MLSYFRSVLDCLLVPFETVLTERHVFVLEKVVRVRRLVGCGALLYVLAFRVQQGAAIRNRGSVITARGQVLPHVVMWLLCHVTRVNTVSLSIKGTLQAINNRFCGLSFVQHHAFARVFHSTRYFLDHVVEALVIHALELATHVVRGVPLQLLHLLHFQLPLSLYFGFVVELSLSLQGRLHPAQPLDV